MSIRARQALVLIAGSLLLAQPALAQDKWSLWSSGRIQLRGANAFQRRVYTAIDGTDFIGPGPVGPPYCPVTPPSANCAPGQDDFQSLKNEGANVVQISGPGIYTENSPYVLDQAVRDNLDGLIAKATAAGLKVVISFRTGPGRSEGAFNYLPPAYDNETVWANTAQGAAARNAWVAMWTATAAYYKDNPNVVAYEMMVEPNSNDKVYGDFDPAHFYALHRDSAADWNPLAAAITGGIRSVDTLTPIIFGGNSYSSYYWLNWIVPTSDTKTVYSVHYYEPFNYSNQDPADGVVYPGHFDPDGNGAVDVNKAWLQNNLTALDDWKIANPSRPLVIGEFGVHRFAGGAQTYFADVSSIFEAKGITHFRWLWHTTWGPSAGDDWFDVRHGSDPDNHTDVTSPLFDATRVDLSPIFKDDFSSGNLNAWSSASTDGTDLRVTGPSPINGGQSLRADVNDLNSLFVRDDTPLSENQYRMRFRFDTGTFDTGAAQGHFRTRIFLGFQETPLRRLFAVVLKYQAGQYSLIGRARRDDGSFADIPPYAITPGTHMVEIQWVEASGPSGGDGFYGLFVDDALIGEVDGLQSYVSALDYVRLGTLSLKGGAGGTLWFDDFDSQRTQQIGN